MREQTDTKIRAEICRLRRELESESGVRGASGVYRRIRKLVAKLASRKFTLKGVDDGET